MATNHPRSDAQSADPTGIVPGFTNHPDLSEDAAIHPWSYNPSAWSQRLPICVLAMVAFLIAAYMGLYQWGLISSAWDPVFGDQTEKVLKSKVAESMNSWMIVPDAILGAIAYLGDALFGLAGSTRRWRNRPWLVILFGIDVIPLGIVSAVLVVMQGLVVGYWCFLCLITAVISLILVYMAYDEVHSSVYYLYRVWKRTRNWTILWKAVWGTPTKEAWEVSLELIGQKKDQKKSQRTDQKKQTATTTS